MTLPSAVVTASMQVPVVRGAVKITVVVVLFAGTLPQLFAVLQVTLALELFVTVAVKVTLEPAGMEADFGEIKMVSAGPDGGAGGAITVKVAVATTFPSAVLAVTV